MAAATLDARDVGARLTIDLDALAANYRKLVHLSAPAACAAVVKANGYGLGAAYVARRLAAEGCTQFFVARLAEGLSLRKLSLLERTGIYVLDGLGQSDPEIFAVHRLTPVLSTVEDVARWAAYCARAGQSLPAALHFDTGINRLGIDFRIAEEIAEKYKATIYWDYVISHLACADEPDHPLTQQQTQRFRSLKAHFPSVPGSLVNSAGLHLGKDHLYELTRPGAALYGITACAAPEARMQTVARVEAPVLQVRTVQAGETIGYGASYKAARDMRVAALGAGYADGYARALGNRAWAFAAGQRVPVAGRVSMDLMVIDISQLPEGAVRAGDFVEILGPNITIDEIARYAGTIGYEVLTSLGGRYERRYLGEAG